MADEPYKNNEMQRLTSAASFETPACYIAVPVQKPESLVPQYLCYIVYSPHKYLCVERVMFCKDTICRAFIYNLASK